MTECAGCDVCGQNDTLFLYANVDGKHYCLPCWKRAGKPWPRRLMDFEINEIESKTRTRMMKRGGPDRHLVRKGRT